MKIDNLVFTIKFFINAILLKYVYVLLKCKKVTNFQFLHLMLEELVYKQKKVHKKKVQPSSLLNTLFSTFL